MTDAEECDMIRRHQDLLQATLRFHRGPGAEAEVKLQVHPNGIPLAAVNGKFTRNELQLIQNALTGLERDYGA